MILSDYSVLWEVSFIIIAEQWYRKWTWPTKFNAWLEGNQNVGLICTCMMEEALASGVLVKHLRIVLFYHSAF